MIFLEIIFILISSFFTIEYIRKNAKKFGLVDVPNERSSHSKITPRGAGIGFGITFFTTAIFFHFFLFIEYWYIFFSLFLVFLIGILDDHKDATARAKFYVIFIATCFLYFFDIKIDSLGTYLNIEISLWYFALPFTMFALAGFTNALNLIDGLDGLAASVTIVILSAYLYIGYVHNDEVLIILTFIPMFTLVSFLCLNWNPAKIFMGDSGSLFLGFLISLVSILSLKYIHPIAVLYLAAVPIVDTLVVMIRRIKRGLSPFSPDKTHIHHILLNFFNKDVKKTVLFLIIMQGLFSLVGMMLVLSLKDIGEGPASTIAIFGFTGVVYLFYVIFTGMKRRQRLLEKLTKRKKRNRKN